MKHNITYKAIVLSILLALVFSAAITSSVQANGILFVKPAASGSGSCLNWENACTFQTALNNANAGDEIWVAVGTYKPTTGTDRNVSFQLKANVTIYGGFVGNEDSRIQRQSSLYKSTILSGDLLDNDNTNIHFDESTRSDNSYHVVEGADNATLDGFVITAGNANGDAYVDRGGGLYNWDSSPILNNLIFTKNTAKRGGGMFNDWCSPTLNDVIFKDNMSILGGGMANDNQSNPELTRVTFDSNVVLSFVSLTEEYIGKGGGMYNMSSSNPSLTNVNFYNNSAQYGGGMANEYSSPVLLNVIFGLNSVTSIQPIWQTYVGSGGGMYNYSSSPSLQNVTFDSNSATGNGHSAYGAGMYNYNSHPVLENVSVTNNSTDGTAGGIFNSSGDIKITNSTISSNTKGGIYNSYASSEFYNVTISNNTNWGIYASGDGATHKFTHVTVARNGGAGIYLANENSFDVQYVYIYNSIFWGNSGLPLQYATIPHFNVYNSVIESGCTSVLMICENILVSDPRLGVLGSYGGYTSTIPILSGSSAINSGNSAYCTEGSDQRGVPYHGICDLGAYEFNEFTGIHFVKPEASGAGDCSNWENACTLQDALTTSGNGSEVWVKEGTYKPTNSADRTASFKITDGLEVYGGFDGTETSRDQRDPAAHRTILSGDIDNNDSQQPIITSLSTVTGNATNSYHVVYYNGLTGATLDGFTITAGFANGGVNPTGQGGGLYSRNAESYHYPTFRITNVTFIGNNANSGGGVYTLISNEITNVTFNGNTATANGGAIYAESGLLLISNTTFSNNSAENGGGIFSQGSAISTNATFTANSANKGGGVYTDNSVGDYRNTLFWGNTAAIGAQAYYSGGILDGILYLSDSIAQGGCPSHISIRCTNIITSDPRLGTLGNFGGATQTVPIQPGSSAINTANQTYCPLVDQRGVSRPQGNGCDIGAFEGEPSTLTLISFTRQNPTSKATKADVLVFRVTFNEIVQNLDMTDFIITGTTGTITELTPVSNEVYDITISGGDLPDLNGVVGLDLSPAQNIVNLIGYALPTVEPAIDETFSVNNTSIFVTSFTRHSPINQVTNADELVFRATFSGAARNVETYAFTVTGTTATITEVTAINASVYDITISGGDLAGLRGTVGLDLAYGTDIGGLDGEPVLFAEPEIDETYEVDNTALALVSFTRLNPLTSLTNAAILIFRVTFTEDANNLDGTDFTVSGTTASVTTISAVGAGIYDITVAGGNITTYNGQVDLNLAGGQNITDPGGNPLSSDEPAIDEFYTLDHTIPTITINAPNNLPAKHKSITASTTEGSLTMSKTALAICNNTLTFTAYTDLTFSTEADNGMRVCYRAEDAVGNIVFKLSDAINGIDTTTFDLVLDGGIIGKPGHLKLFGNQTYMQHFTSIDVVFADDAYNPIDTPPLDPNDVTNPANYLLLQPGPDGAYNTTSCLGFANNGDLPVGDDIQIPIGPVHYTNTDGFVATVTLNHGIPLLSGLYRLFICGSTSIVDLAGNELNGGKDILLDFTITETPEEIPQTGFAPDRSTALQKPTMSYIESDLWLEIPKLGVKLDIVGVPLVDGNWDVSWLGKQAGWLEGSTYPTWNGNSVLTGHVWNADNSSGPFHDLNTLVYGDQVIVHAGDTEYIYEVRKAQQVSPENTAQMLKHEELSWLTLVTCRGYDPVTNEYKYRELVRAVLVDVN